MTDVFTQQFLVETWIAVGNKIDVLWNMFIAIHFAVFGFIFTITHNRSLRIHEKLVAMVAYSIFLYINFNALLSSYEFLQALTLQYQNSFLESTKLTPSLKAYIEGLDYSHKVGQLALTHGFGLVIVFFTLGFNDKILPLRKRSLTENN